MGILDDYTTKNDGSARSNVRRTSLPRRTVLRGNEKKKESAADVAKSISDQTSLYCAILYVVNAIVVVVSMVLFVKGAGGSGDAEVEYWLPGLIGLLASAISIFGISIFKNICKALVILLDDIKRRNTEGN